MIQSKTSSLSDVVVEFPIMLALPSCHDNAGDFR